MLKIDLHIHTIASGHANCTLVEYINQAKKNKMKTIGITDHGPANSETVVTEIYFTELMRIPKKVKGIRILKGIEANIIGDGQIDISSKAINQMDYVMAGMHKHAGFVDQGSEKNTAAIINLIKSGNIDILTHPFVMNFNVDIEKIAHAACQNDVLLEVNAFYLTGIRGPEKHLENLTNLKKIIKIVKEHKKKVIVNSDAHNIWELGDDSCLKKIKKEIGLSEDMIINNYPKLLFQQLNIKN